MSLRARAATTPETWLFLALGGLLAVGISTGVSTPTSPAWIVVLAVSVAIAGLPHGALDPWVAWRAGLWRTRWGLAGFHLAYIALAALVVAAWYLAPGASLLVFLVLSGWHFAGDWRHALPGWARAAAGGALLALPAWRWPLQVEQAFMLLSGTQGAAIAAWLSGAAPWFAAGMAVATLLALRRSPTTALELAGVAALALLLPPLPYFIVYFCALHSLRHLRLAALGADAVARRRMAGVAAAYTVATLLLAAAAWPWLAGLGSPAQAPAAHLLKLVFIGLAALTLPHMLVVMRSEHVEAKAPRA